MWPSPVGSKALLEDNSNERTKCESGKGKTNRNHGIHQVQVQPQRLPYPVEVARSCGWWGEDSVPDLYNSSSSRQPGALCFLLESVFD